MARGCRHKKSACNRVGRCCAKFTRVAKPGRGICRDWKGIYSLGLSRARFLGRGNGLEKCRKWLAQRYREATVRGLADRDERNRHTGGVPRTIAMLRACSVWIVFLVVRVAVVRRLANRGKDNPADQMVSCVQQSCHSKCVQASCIWLVTRLGEIARNKCTHSTGARDLASSRSEHWLFCARCGDRNQT